MKRYNVFPDVRPEAMTVPTQGKVQAIEDKAGEWVKAEDALTLRKKLFMATVGHPEHHQTQSCSGCNSLREELA